MRTSTVQVGKNIINVGRDFKGNIVNNNPNELFSKINVSGFSKNYVAPTIASHILADVKKHGLTIIGGDFQFDKGSLLNYLAEQLQLSTSFEVYEWVGTPERQSLFSALKGMQNKIVVFQKLQPHHLNYDLQVLEKSSRQQQLTFLVSTDIPAKVWQLTSTFKQKFWLDLDSNNIKYDASLLKEYLAEQLDRNIKEITFTNGLNKVDVNSKLPGGTISQLAKNFTTPEQIEFFAKELTACVGGVDIDAIKDALKVTLSKQDTLMQKWFHSLSQLEQYVALSMVLFTGLFDDQYFGVVRKLSETEWKHSHNGLKALDYKDIEKLFNFFKYDVIDRDRRFIRNKYPNQLIDMFKITWYSHRRHIKMALDVGVGIVIESCENNLNSELYGSREKRDILRKSVMHFISDVGRVSKNLIDEPLLILASQDALASQSVAAGAIAKWREIPGGEKQLFDMLSSWQESSKWSLLIDELIKGRESASAPSAYLRSTIILTIGKAAKYDTPDQLSLQLIELLFSFLQDTNGLVRNRLIRTLPDIIRYHAIQLGRSLQLNAKQTVPLEQLLKHDDLIYPVAIGLALAHFDRPLAIGKTIDACLTHCKKKISESKKTQLGDRDKLMVTMILTLGKIIELHDFNTRIGGKPAYDILKSIRLREKNIIIGNVLVHTIIQLILFHRKNKDLIKILLPKLSARERDAIINEIAEQYKYERQKQFGGDMTMKIDDVIYDTWVKTDRPFLDIEKLMFDWLRDDSKQLKQIATFAFVKFAAFIEYEEAQIHKDIKEKEEQLALVEKRSKTQDIFKSALVKGRFSLITFVYKIFIKATISKGAAKILDAALPVISKSYMFNRGYKKVVIEKWKRVGGDVKVAAKSISRLAR